MRAEYLRAGDVCRCGARAHPGRISESSFAAGGCYFDFFAVGFLEAGAASGFLRVRVPLEGTSASFTLRTGVLAGFAVGFSTGADAGLETFAVGFSTGVGIGAATFRVLLPIVGAGIVGCGGTASRFGTRTVRVTFGALGEVLGAVSAPTGAAVCGESAAGAGMRRVTRGVGACAGAAVAGVE